MGHPLFKKEVVEYSPCRVLEEATVCNNENAFASANSVLNKISGHIWVKFVVVVVAAVVVVF